MAQRRSKAEDLLAASFPYKSVPTATLRTRLEQAQGAEKLDIERELYRRNEPRKES